MHNPGLFLEDTDPAVNGSQSVGYDFSAVNYSDLESNTVGKGVRVSGLQSCWFGGLRNVVTDNFVFSHNTIVKDDPKRQHLGVKKMVENGST